MKGVRLFLAHQYKIILTISIIFGVLGFLPSEFLSIHANADLSGSLKATSSLGSLQIDRSLYLINNGTNTAVEASGILNNFNPLETKVTLSLTLPDGTTQTTDVVINKDGTFQTSLPLDPTSQTGGYAISASYNGNSIGALTFMVKKITALSNPVVNIPKPAPIPNAQNNTQSSQLNSESLPQNPSKIPKWVRNIFLWYGQGQVSEDELLGAIKFLIQNNIISLESNTVAPTSNISPSPSSVPQSTHTTQPDTSSETNYPVSLQINMKKDQIEFGEPLTLSVKFNPEIDNTPVTIKILNSSGGVIESSGDSSIKSNSDYKAIGEYRFTTLPRFPNGEYSIEVQFGPDNQILGKQEAKFTYSNNTNSVGNEYRQKYLPTFLDIGTNFIFNYPQYHFPEIDPCIFSCKNIGLETVIDQTLYSNYPCGESDQGCYHIAVIEFDNQTDAKKYAAMSNQWQGTPSSAGNYAPRIDTAAINSDPKQCFGYDGGFFSANGANGLLKCTDSRFVVVIDNNNKMASEIINSIIKKIDSTPSGTS